jgi:ubiquinone/menaquinone biosynthesis C-methylase UbiE
VKFAPRGGRGRRRFYQFRAIDEATRFRVLRIYDQSSTKTARGFPREVRVYFPFAILKTQTDLVSEETKQAMPPQTEKPSPFSKIEAVLRQHPHVREAKVSCEDPGSEALTAYIVSPDEYIGLASTEADEERKRIQRWRKTFDLTQMGREASAPEPDFNIAGWNSSYTRKPIPSHEMREWVEQTVAEITSLQPKEILEIGCGTGLLLLRLAPHCKRYVATDFASAVLEKLRNQMDQLAGSWDGVELLERPGDNFERLAEGSFDTVIVNSVTHYFPNASYLTKVMEGAARLLKPGGNVFIGDVRSLPLLETYATSVELYQASPEMEVAELRERVMRRVKQEEQLVISPAYFLAQAERNPKLSGAEIRLKRGRSDNEMTRFRYDVILHAASKQNVHTEVEWRDWTEDGGGIEDIRRSLKNEKPGSVAITGIRNARVEKDVEAVKRVSDAGARGTAGELKRELEAAEPSGMAPEGLCSAGEDAGYRVELSWAGCQADGSFDAVLSRSDGSAVQWKPLKWPQPSTKGMELAKYTNVPGQNAFRERLVQKLLSYCKENLPENLVPSAVVVVDALPQR